MKPAKNTIITLVDEVCSLLAQVTGIQLGEKQFHMVEAKLTRRMYELNLEGPEEYLGYLKTNLREETTVLVSLLTTHHTFFFREFFHFEYLERTGLPRVLAALRKEGRKTLRVWSAACSRGQEMYSLSMCLSAYLKIKAPDMSFDILGTDIDQESVGFARNGVYRWDEVKEIPQNYLFGNWVRGTGEISDYVKARPVIKSQSRFGIVNLLDLNSGSIVTGQNFDIIFCRNVFIYFSQPQVLAVTLDLLKMLTPEGLLFLGVSESLIGMDIPVEHLGQSIYSRKRSQPALELVSARKVPVQMPSPAASVVPVAPRPALAVASRQSLRVICVDDSPVVLALMKKFLSEEFGFEVVATAQNGFEATEKLRTVRADVMTLDIHMPGQSGIEYLQSQFKPGHPPVVIVSSVSRESASLAIRCLELGAADYVEKPTYAELTQRGDEIRTKLRCAARPEHGGALPNHELEKSFQSDMKITAPEKKFRLVLGGAGDLRKIRETLASSEGPQPATVVLLSVRDNLLAEMAAQLQGGWGKPEVFSELLSANLSANSVLVGDLDKDLEKVKTRFFQRFTSIMVHGAITRAQLRQLRTWPECQIVLEDLKINVEAVNQAYDSGTIQLVPVTSFSYLSNLYLSRKGRE